MRCDPLFDDLTYGLPSAPVEGLIDGTRYTATASYDVDTDHLDYRLRIVPAGIAPIAVSAARLGLFGRHRGARVEWRGHTIAIHDTAQVRDGDLRAALELALTRAGVIGTQAARAPAGLRRKGAGCRRRSQRPHVGATSVRLAALARRRT
jgi:hypothetical protein